MTLDKLKSKNINFKCLRRQRELHILVLKFPQDYFLTVHPKLMEMPLRSLDSMKKTLSFPQNLLPIKCKCFHFYSSK